MVLGFDIHLKVLSNGTIFNEKTSRRESVRCKWSVINATHGTNLKQRISQLKDTMLSARHAAISFS